MIVICFILSAYIMTILSLAYGFSKMKSFCFEKTIPKTRFTIVVPFRNEKENLPVLLNSISRLDYPAALFEVILVDDDSTDGYSPEASEQGTAPRLQSRIIANCRISASPKKDAIQSAIALAKYEWIITTDADCVVPEQWLTVLDAFIQENSCEMVAGGVTYNPGIKFLEHFQQLDLAALQGVTIGSFGLGNPFMCNGANFAYSKKLFDALSGFDGNQGHAGGDDVFLLQKAVVALPEKVGYLKSHLYTVVTKPAQTSRGLFYQRVRWASKTGSYQSDFGKLLGLTALLGNAAWICGLVLLFADVSGIGIVLLLLLKWIVDWILIHQTNAFFRKPTRHYLLSAMVYPLFSTVVAVYAVFGKYEWKGRRF